MGESQTMNNNFKVENSGRNEETSAATKYLRKKWNELCVSSKRHKMLWLYFCIRLNAETATAAARWLMSSFWGFDFCPFWLSPTEENTIVLRTNQFVCMRGNKRSRRQNRKVLTTWDGTGRHNQGKRVQAYLLCRWWQPIPLVELLQSATTPRGQLHQHPHHLRRSLRGK